MDTPAHQNPASEAFLGAAPAGRWDRRLAAAFVGLSFVGLLAIAPFARLHLPPLPQFVPAYESALWVCDLATALLLLGQFHRSRSPSLLALSAGYLMSSLIIPPHMMAFPGLFAPRGLLGGNGQTIAWLYVLWHTGFPLFVLAHSLAARLEVRLGWTVRRPAPAMLGALAVVLAYVALCVWLAVTGTFLPVISVNGQYERMLTTGVAPVMVGISAAALASIWFGRRGSVLDVWLTAVMSAWVCDTTLSSLLSNTRFDLGWYAGRVYTLMAGAFLLGVLLLDLSRLYGRLADALEEARARNEALVRSREELTRAQRMEAVGQLTGGIAHDFNNILTAVTGCLEMIVRKPDDAARVSRLSHNAATAAERGAQLVRQLLTFSRRQNLKPQVLDANDLLLEMATLARKALGESVVLKFDLAEALDRICVDASEFQAAILNLLSNARDAMPEGGAVTIRTRNEAAAQDGPYVVVSVDDTGEGMDAATVARVFEPFFTTKEVGRGTGLGLSQVYGFAESAGGHVDIESVPREGSSVTLYLPRTLQSPPEADPPPPPAPLGKRQRVLLVEDDEDVISATAEALRDAGFEVATAATGSQALAVLRSDARVDLLFTDLMMPGGLDGVALAEAGLQTRPDLKVLLTSGYSETLLRERGRLGDLPILAKPYHRDELVRRLQGLLRRSGTDGGQAH